MTTTLKLLIADDDASLRLLVSATLSSEEYEILQATTGTEALQLAQSQRPRLVLLDVRMPGMDGVEVCRRIKSDPDLHATRVVMLTAEDAKADKEAGLAAGADAYLTKPFWPIQLLTTVERLMAVP